MYEMNGVQFSFYTSVLVTTSRMLSFLYLKLWFILCHALIIETSVFVWKIMWCANSIKQVLYAIYVY